MVALIGVVPLAAGVFNFCVFSPLFGFGPVGPTQGPRRMKTVRSVRSVTPEQAWTAVQEGRARLFDLRTELERRRYGWPPGAPRVSLTRHIAPPAGPDTIYLCQHANRSKLTGRRGAAEVAGGWPAWEAAGLPIDRDENPPRQNP